MDVYGLWPSIGYWEDLFCPFLMGRIPWDFRIGASQVLQKPADWICSASDVDKKKGRKLDPNEDLRNKGFKAPGAPGKVGIWIAVIPKNNPGG